MLHKQKGKIAVNKNAVNLEITISKLVRIEIKRFG